MHAARGSSFKCVQISTKTNRGHFLRTGCIHVHSAFKVNSLLSKDRVVAKRRVLRLLERHSLWTRYAQVALP